MKPQCVSLAVLLIAGLSGCMLTPRYHKSELSVPATWSEEQDGGPPPTQPTDLTRWWTTFHDPTLHALIDQGIAANLNVYEPQARIREARALRVITAADGWPLLEASGSYARNRGSENVVSVPSELSDGDTGGGARSFFSIGEEREFFQTSFDARWELDVFGRVRWSVKAAEADIAAAEENLRDVLVTLLADIARNYVELRGFQHRLTIAQENIQAQQEAAELTQARFQAGLTSALDVAQAEALLATIRAEVPTLVNGVRQSIHRLSVLLGQAPGALLEELSPQAPIPDAALDGTIGLPSDLLRRRPDVRRAERELAAAIARIGVATADLFPRFSLTGVFGFQGLELSDLTQWSSRFWTTGPTISWPIFDAGRIRANIRAQNARQEQALARYEQAILTSLEDVENALVAYAREQERLRLLADAVRANDEALALANERYVNGVENFLNVLIAQRALYTARDELAQSEVAVVVNLVALYKALGGGWEVYAAKS